MYMISIFAMVRDAFLLVCFGVSIGIPIGWSIAKRFRNWKSRSRTATTTHN